MSCDDVSIDEGVGDRADVGPILMALWAKHGKRPGYHPLLYHLMDVAAAALALWDLSLIPRTRERLASALGIPQAEARVWIAFLAGGHDVGKATIAFNRQVSAALDRLDRVGLVGGAAVAHDAPHGAVSALALGDLLPGFGMSTQIAERVAAVVGAHHGQFHERHVLKALPPSAIGSGPWKQSRHDLIAALARLLNVPPEAPSMIDTSTAMWLAGFVTVADWIGSDEQFFPWAASDGAIPPFDHYYLARAEAQARDALHSLGWEAQPPPPMERAFAELFNYEPNDMQRAIVDLRPCEQGLVIVEASTGSGKTEAALWLADNWSRLLGTRGFYIALPTQATSNQMFGRVLEFLRRRYPGHDVNLQLLHGHASLVAEFEALQREEPRRPSDINAGEGDVLAAEWFTRRKRGLLAPYGVGTVDQLLLAVLQTRHHFVRLFGLAGRTVIIDEVHAYDTYMSTLLEKLLHWLAALGSPVVLLSATLPDSRRRALAQAYVAGLGRSFSDPGTGRYPRLTWVGTTTGPTTIAVKPPPDRTVGIGWLDERDLASRLQTALRNGGVAAVICNSVGRAQEIYTDLKRAFPTDELDLLHARYPYGSRAERELRTVNRFGKDGARPRYAVLVATQIVEQSLDIDFDLLVTDLPPVDLLLQRMGRLHRHDRVKRPIHLPETWILRPERITAGIPDFADAAHMVYSAFILLRTWIVLRGRESIHVPRDVQALVEAVYDGDGFPETTPEEQRRLKELEQEQNQEIENEEHQARMREIKDPEFGGHLAMVARDPRAEEAPELHPVHQALTRLADLSVPVVLLDQDNRLPDGTVVDPSSAPANALVRRILERSVSISSRLCVHALRTQQAPSGWARSPLLRNHRIITIPKDGVAHVGSAAISLDPELGVVIKPWKGMQ